jgi:gamma-glutamylcyclotransferase (GGCT)/AIG2-like uncharacterized protein YtfP
MSAKTPRSGLFDELKRRRFFSPDYKFYRYYRTQLLFVYDNLRYGGSDYTNYLKDAKWLGKACTCTDNYVMETVVVTSKSGTRRKVPVVYPEAGATSANIHGDMFLVSPEHLLAIDDFMLNDGILDRQQQKFFLLDQESFKHKEIRTVFDKMMVSAHVYLTDFVTWKDEDYLSKIADLNMPDEYGEAVVKGHAIKSWIKPYYEYTNTDILNARIPRTSYGPFGRTTKEDYNTLFGESNHDDDWMGDDVWRRHMMGC